MTRDQFPWLNLTDREVKRLTFAGFCAHEIATIAGVPDDVGEVMRNKALGRSPAEWNLRDDICLPDGSVPAIDTTPQPYWINHAEAA